MQRECEKKTSREYAKKGNGTKRLRNTVNDGTVFRTEEVMLSAAAVVSLSHRVETKNALVLDTLLFFLISFNSCFVLPNEILRAAMSENDNHK